MTPSDSTLKCIKTKGREDKIPSKRRDIVAPGALIEVEEALRIDESGCIPLLLDDSVHARTKGDGDHFPSLAQSPAELDRYIPH
jgi:hypothetical protein